MKRTITLISVCFAISCSEHQGEKTVIEKEVLNVPHLNDSVQLNSNIYSNQFLITKFDLNKIKLDFQNAYTSGKLSNTKIANFYFEKTNSYFGGIYFFTTNSIDVPFYAKAVVICKNCDGWDYFNDNEELVEISIYSNQINPFSDIVRIGQPKDSVIERIGTNYKEYKNRIVYFDSIGNATTFIFDNNVLQIITIGKYVDVNKL